MEILFSPPVQFRSCEEQELWNSLLASRSEFERARDASRMLSGSPESPESQQAGRELAESRRQYLLALKAFTSYVWSSLPP